MKRLYFLAPNTAIAHQVVDSFMDAGSEEHQIHVVAAPGTDLENLPQATLAEKSYLLPALKKGAGYGGSMGLLFGLAAINLPTAVLAGGALLTMGAIGAGMGAFLGCLIGADKENLHVSEAASAIENGQLLILVDVAEERVGEYETLIKQHYPDVTLKSTEATHPDFPY